MRKSINNMSCAEFQAQLPDLICSTEEISDHPHVRSCRLCRALLADLSAIADAARLLFPVEEPRDALWEHIETAIVNHGTAQGR
jgi:hypothetical protein